MRRILSSMLMVGILASCATTPEQGLSLKTAESPAYSVDAPQKDLIVAVSPARQTLQVVGTTGLLLGAGISAIANAKHRAAVEKILDGYSPIELLHERISQRLVESAGAKMSEVQPLGSSVGYKDQREAEMERIRSLRRRGHDLLLDLNIVCGLYGFEGTLAAKVEGELRNLAKNEVVWKNTLVVTSEEVLASDRLTDPTKRMGPDMHSPRLTVEEGAVDQWTSDGGAVLKTRMDQAIEGVVSALLTELGLAQDARGYYYLGRLAMNRKEFSQAHEYYEAALKLDPELLSAKSALAVNLAHNGQIQQAVSLSQEITEAHPNYGPAQYNLAWWLATESKQPDEARGYYERALALGMPKEKKIEKALEKETQN